MMDLSKVEKGFDAAVAQGVFPGAVLLVHKEGETVYHRAFGHRSLEPERTPMREDTIFDLSSLTKPLATTNAFLLLARDRKLRFDDRVTRLFHNFGVHGKTHITFRNLLRHDSGLAGWRAFYKEVQRVEKDGRLNFLCSNGAKQLVYDLVQREKPDHPPGESTVYSDLNFILLGNAVESITSTGLDRLCHDRIFRPLGLRSTSFVDLSMIRSKRLRPVTEMIAPTELCAWRGRILCGEVDDNNAYAMGGVSGHTGLFSNALEVDALVRLVRDAWHGVGDLLPCDLVREVLTPDEGKRPLGWDIVSPVGSQAGTRFSKQTVGHLGFTGTSIWLDLERHVHVILLTNRVHPSRSNDRIKTFRPAIHDLILEGLGQ